MPLTPADVRNKQFSTTRLRPGYDEEEVDAFLDEVEAELDRLIQENEELRAKLAECLRGKVPGGMGMAMAPAPVAEPKPEMMLPPPPEPIKPPEPVQVPAPVSMMPPPEDNMDTAARVLALAQQTADQAISDARREADETVTRARREADEILGKARRQAEQVIGDARARAETLERDAQERHRQAMGSLVQTRDELERKVEELRSFEREYRSRLKLYLEDRLADLNVSADASGAFPIVGAAQMGANQIGAAPVGPPQIGSGQMGGGQMGGGQMGGGQMGPGQMGPGQMSGGQMGGGQMGPAPAMAPHGPGVQQAIPGGPPPFGADPAQHPGAFQTADGPHSDRR